MQKYDHPLLPDHYYHVFNRAVGSERLFNTNENYQFFLKRFLDYVLPVADVFCYSLLPNHFHFFIRIKPLQTLQKFHLQIKNKHFIAKPTYEIHDFVMDQFSNWCNSYTKAFNRENGRKGKLFMEALNRKIIRSQSYYSSIIFYIHNNPVKHNITKKPADWSYSSYNLLLSDGPCWLSKNELFDWFGGKAQFIQFHEQNQA